MRQSVDNYSNTVLSNPKMNLFSFIKHFSTRLNTLLKLNKLTRSTLNFINTNNYNYYKCYNDITTVSYQVVMIPLLIIELQYYWFVILYFVSILFQFISCSSISIFCIVFSLMHSCYNLLYFKSLDLFAEIILNLFDFYREQFTV